MTTYIAAAATCWKCHRNITVYAWPPYGDVWKEEQPPNPIPKTIHYRKTFTTEQFYWINVCPHCDAVQGDWYLYCEPDGAFFRLGQEDYPSPDA
jgi:uncharacterized CHY-type Zn-finger protein